MRKTVFALLLVLPMMAACTTTAPSTPAASTAPSTAPATTTPVVAVPGAAGAGSVTTGAATGDATIVYKDFNFTPNSVTIKAGQSVAFQNPAGNTAKLYVNSDDGSVNSNFIDPGASFVQKYDKAGTYTFKHQTQTAARGTVIVQ